VQLSALIKPIPTRSESIRIWHLSTRWCKGVRADPVVVQLRFIRRVQARVASQCLQIWEFSEFRDIAASRGQFRFRPDYLIQPAFVGGRVVDRQPMPDLAPISMAKASASDLQRWILRLSTTVDDVGLRVLQRNLQATRANSKVERLRVANVKCRPTLGSATQKTLAVPQRSRCPAHLPSRRCARHRVLPHTTFLSRHGLKSWARSRMRMVSLSTRGLREDRLLISMPDGANKPEFFLILRRDIDTQRWTAHAPSMRRNGSYKNFRQSKN
jgi:hypothetical protein